MYLTLDLRITYHLSCGHLTMRVFNVLGFDLNNCDLMNSSKALNKFYLLVYSCCSLTRMISCKCNMQLNRVSALCAYLTILDFIQGNTMQLYEKYKNVMEVVAIKSDWPRSLYVSKTLIAYSGNDLFKYLYMF